MKRPRCSFAAQVHEDISIELRHVELAFRAGCNYVHHPYGKSGHYGDRLRGTYGRALHRSRWSFTARAHGDTARRPADDNEHCGKFPRVSRGHRRM